MDDQLKRAGEVRDSRHLSPLLKMALLLGVLVHLSGFFIFGVISNPLPLPEEEPAFISLVPTGIEGDEAELIEQASLFDSAPLFIPGEWNSASRVLPSKIFQDWQASPDFEPGLELMELMEEVRPERLSLAQVAGVDRPSDLLNLRFWDLFSYFGQGKVQVEKQEAWHSLAEVSILSGNKADSSDSMIRLRTELSPEQFGPGPVVFLVNMHAPGLPIAAPLLSQSSGSDALDAKALEWLTRPETLAKLPAGFLKVRIFQ